MIRSLVLTLMLSWSPALVFGQPSVAESHTEANVPPRSSFDSILKRDLEAYFITKGVAVPKVDYALLRDGPTQTGIAFPKFYAWVRISSGNKLVEGAVRLAAMNRTQFEVTHFLSREQIVAAPTEVGKIFPAPLVSAIVQKAGTR